jgi:hypothetical protein
MTISEGTRKALANIAVTRGRAYAAEQGDTEETPRSPEEDWAINRNALMHHVSASNWEAALDTLVYLSTREGHPEQNRALAHRVWLALRAPVPATDVVLSLSSLQVAVGPQHQSYAPVAALAHLMAERRTPDHPERELARFQSRQMLQLAASAAGIDGDQFATWASGQKLDDADYVISIVLATLEDMVEGDWWLQPEQVDPNVP